MLKIKEKREQKRRDEAITKALNEGPKKSPITGLPQEEPLKEEHPLANLLLLRRLPIKWLGTGAAKTIEFVGEKAMPSSFLKGVGTYLPWFAKTAETVSPYADAAALSYWSTKAAQEAKKAYQQGDTTSAATYGTMAALPIAMPILANPSRSLKAVNEVGTDLKAAGSNVKSLGETFYNKEGLQRIVDDTYSVLGNRAEQIANAAGATVRDIGPNAVNVKYELPIYGLSRVNPNDPIQVESAVEHYKKVNPGFLKSKTQVFTDSSGETYYEIGTLPMYDNSNLDRNLIASRLDNLVGSHWRRGRSPFLDPITERPIIAGNEDILFRKAGNDDFHVVIPKDDSYQSAGFYILEGPKRGKSFLDINSENDGMPIRFTQLHEGIAHPTEFMVLNQVDRASKKPIKDLYSEISSPKDLFPDFEKFFELSGSKDPGEARASNLETAKILLEFVSHKTNIPLNKVYENSRVILEDFLNKYAKTDDQLVDLLYSLQQPYLEDYANLLNHYKGTTNGHIYADRIRNMLTTYPAIAGIGVVGAGAIGSAIDKEKNGGKMRKIIKAQEGFNTDQWLISDYNQKYGTDVKTIEQMNVDAAMRKKKEEMGYKQSVWDRAKSLMPQNTYTVPYDYFGQARRNAQEAALMDAVKASDNGGDFNEIYNQSMQDYNKQAAIYGAKAAATSAGIVLAPEILATLGPEAAAFYNTVLTGYNALKGGMDTIADIRYGEDVGTMAKDLLATTSAGSKFKKAAGFTRGASKAVDLTRKAMYTADNINKTTSAAKNLNSDNSGKSLAKGINNVVKTIKLWRK